MKLRKMLMVGGTTLTAIVALVAPAAAHTSVLLDETDKVPVVAPLAVDGTDAIRFFGVIPRRNNVRSFQLALRAGQPVIVNLAIPDRAPENALAVADLPRAFLVGPDWSVTVLNPTIRVPHHNDELGLDVLALRSHQAAAVTGTYSVIVTSRQPARFVVATGADGEAFHGLLRGNVATDEQILDWYATAP